jgi:hypothetical protein
MLAVTCQKSSTSATVTGLVILLGIVGAIVSLAVANGGARQRLASANAELGYLRPELARLQQWMAGGTGTAPSGSPAPGRPVTGDGPATYAIPPQWCPDPSGRHELRYWDGVGWSEQVSDRGTPSTDAAV